MQISRHWRMQPQRYRLQGVRFKTGEMYLDSRPVPISEVKAPAKQPLKKPVLYMDPEQVAS